MHAKHIADLDLNLLKLLGALLDTCSVTRAAERLGIGQPAASRALARVRKVLDDPLLVRVQGRSQLTPHAEHLKAEVAQAMHALDRVFMPPRFDPATTTRRFRIATTDYGSLSVLGHVVPAFLRCAPLARLDVLPWSDTTLDALASSDIDLALYADDPLPPAYAYRRLFSETYCCLFRRGHPIGSRARSGSLESRMKALAGYPQAVIAYPSGRVTQYDDLFEQTSWLRERIAVSLPYFLAAPWVIAESDLILVVPTRIAIRLAPIADLDSVDFPLRKTSFDYRMVWHERTQHDTEHRWLRNLIFKNTEQH